MLDLDWCAEDDLLVGDVRRRFGQVPMIAMIDRPWPDLVERLVTAGIGECLSAAELGQRIGERILVHLVATAERDRAIETWRRRANEAERRFAETIERSSDGMLIIDAAGMVRYANRAAQVMLGRKATALVGFDFGNPLAMVVAELDLVRGDGEPIIVELRVTEIVWNEAPARLAALRDVTARRREAEAFNESVRKARTVLDTMVDGLIVIDERGRIESFNAAAEVLFGYGAEQVVGRNISMLMPEPYARQHNGYLARYLRTNEARVVGQRRELVGRRVDGSTFPIELGVSEIRREDWSGRGGGERLFIGLIRDITERKRAENAIMAAKTQAEMANRGKSEFLANMSHELRTPLNAILGFAEIIRDRLFGTDALDKYAEYGKDIHDSGSHLLEVINDVLDMSKIEAGRYKLIEETFEIAPIVRSCLVMVGDRARDGKVALRTAIDTDLPVIRADRRAVKQVLLNLLSNAVKFTPGGGTVTVSAEVDPDIGIAITVSDTGIGIAEDQLPHVFTPFLQLEPAASRKYEGTGLGLAISKSFMELQGGALTIDSQVDVGTTVTAWLPPARIVRPAASRALGAAAGCTANEGG